MKERYAKTGPSQETKNFAIYVAKGLCDAFCDALESKSAAEWFGRIAGKPYVFNVLGMVLAV